MDYSNNELSTSILFYQNVTQQCQALIALFQQFLTQLDPDDEQQVAQRIQLYIQGLQVIVQRSDVYRQAEQYIQQEFQRQHQMLSRSLPRQTVIYQAFMQSVLNVIQRNSVVNIYDSGRFLEFQSRNTQYQTFLDNVQRILNRQNNSNILARHNIEDIIQSLTRQNTPLRDLLHLENSTRVRLENTIAHGQDMLDSLRSMVRGLPIAGVFSQIVAYEAGKTQVQQVQQTQVEPFEMPRIIYNNPQPLQQQDIQQVQQPQPLRSYQRSPLQQENQIVQVKQTQQQQVVPFEITWLDNIHFPPLFRQNNISYNERKAIQRYLDSQDLVYPNAYVIYYDQVRVNDSDMHDLYIFSLMSDNSIQVASIRRYSNEVDIIPSNHILPTSVIGTQMQYALTHIQSGLENAGIPRILSVQSVIPRMLYELYQQGFRVISIGRDRQNIILQYRDNGPIRIINVNQEVLVQKEEIFEIVTLDPQSSVANNLNPFSLVVSNSDQLIPFQQLIHERQRPFVSMQDQHKIAEALNFILNLENQVDWIQDRQQQNLNENHIPLRNLQNNADMQRIFQIYMRMGQQDANRVQQRPVLLRIQNPNQNQAQRRRNDQARRQQIQMNIRRRNLQPGRGPPGGGPPGGGPPGGGPPGGGPPGGGPPGGGPPANRPGRPGIMQFALQRALRGLIRMGQHGFIAAGLYRLIMENQDTVNLLIDHGIDFYYDVLDYFDDFDEFDEPPIEPPQYGVQDQDMHEDIRDVISRRQSKLIRESPKFINLYLDLRRRTGDKYFINEDQFTTKIREFSDSIIELMSTNINVHPTNLTYNQIVKKLEQDTGLKLQQSLIREYKNQIENFERIVQTNALIDKPTQRELQGNRLLSHIKTQDFKQIGQFFTKQIDLRKGYKLLSYNAITQFEFFFSPRNFNYYVKGLESMSITEYLFTFLDNTDIVFLANRYNVQQDYIQEVAKSAINDVLGEEKFSQLYEDFTFIKTKKQPLTDIFQRIYEHIQFSLVMNGNLVTRADDYIIKIHIGNIALQILRVYISQQYDILKQQENVENLLFMTYYDKGETWKINTEPSTIKHIDIQQATEGLLHQLVVLYLLERNPESFKQILLQNKDLKLKDIITQHMGTELYVQQLRFHCDKIESNIFKDEQTRTDFLKEYTQNQLKVLFGQPSTQLKLSQSLTYTSNTGKKYELTFSQTLDMFYYLQYTNKGKFVPFQQGNILFSVFNTLKYEHNVPFLQNMHLVLVEVFHPLTKRRAYVHQIISSDTKIAQQLAQGRYAYISYKGTRANMQLSNIFYQENMNGLINFFSVKDSLKENDFVVPNVREQYIQSLHKDSIFQVQLQGVVSFQDVMQSKENIENSLQQASSFAYEQMKSKQIHAKSFKLTQETIDMFQLELNPLTQSSVQQYMQDQFLYTNTFQFLGAQRAGNNWNSIINVANSDRQIKSSRQKVKYFNKDFIRRQVSVQANIVKQKYETKKQIHDMKIQTQRTVYYNTLKKYAQKMSEKIQSKKDIGLENVQPVIEEQVFKQSQLLQNNLDQPVKAETMILDEQDKETIKKDVQDIHEMDVLNKQLFGMMNDEMFIDLIKDSHNDFGFRNYEDANEYQYEIGEADMTPQQFREQLDRYIPNEEYMGEMYVPELIKKLSQDKEISPFYRNLFLRCFDTNQDFKLKHLTPYSGMEVLFELQKLVKSKHKQFIIMFDEEMQDYFNDINYGLLAYLCEDDMVKFNQDDTSQMHENIPDNQKTTQNLGKLTLETRRNIYNHYAEQFVDMLIKYTQYYIPNQAFLSGNHQLLVLNKGTSKSTSVMHDPESLKFFNFANAITVGSLYSDDPEKAFFELFSQYKNEEGNIGLPVVIQYERFAYQIFSLDHLQVVFLRDAQKYIEKDNIDNVFRHMFYLTSMETIQSDYNPLDMRYIQASQTLRRKQQIEFEARHELELFQKLNLDIENRNVDIKHIDDNTIDIYDLSYESVFAYVLEYVLSQQKYIIYSKTLEEYIQESNLKTQRKSLTEIVENSEFKLTILDVITRNVINWEQVRTKPMIDKVQYVVQKMHYDSQIKTEGTEAGQAKADAIFQLYQYNQRYNILDRVKKLNPDKKLYSYNDLADYLLDRRNELKLPFAVRDHELISDKQALTQCFILLEHLFNPGIFQEDIHIQPDYVNQGMYFIQEEKAKQLINQLRGFGLYEQCMAHANVLHSIQQQQISTYLKEFNEFSQQSVDTQVKAKLGQDLLVKTLYLQNLVVTETRTLKKISDLIIQQLGLIKLESQKEYQASSGLLGWLESVSKIFQTDAISFSPFFTSVVGFIRFAKKGTKYVYDIKKYRISLAQFKKRLEKIMKTGLDISEVKNFQNTNTVLSQSFFASQGLAWNVIIQQLMILIQQRLEKALALYEIELQLQKIQIGQSQVDYFFYPLSDLEQIQKTQNEMKINANYPLTIGNMKVHSNYEVSSNNVKQYFADEQEFYQQVLVDILSSNQHTHNQSISSMWDRQMYIESQKLSGQSIGNIIMMTDGLNTEFQYEPKIIDQFFRLTGFRTQYADYPLVGKHQQENAERLFAQVTNSAIIYSQTFPAETISEEFKSFAGQEQAQMEKIQKHPFHPSRFSQQYHNLNASVKNVGKARILYGKEEANVNEEYMKMFSFFQKQQKNKQHSGSAKSSFFKNKTHKDTQFAIRSKELESTKDIEKKVENKDNTFIMRKQDQQQTNDRMKIFTQIMENQKVDYAQIWRFVIQFSPMKVQQDQVSKLMRYQLVMQLL